MNPSISTARSRDATPGPENWWDRFTDGEIGEPFHFNPPVPGRYPRAGGLLIIHFIDYDYLIRKNILDTSLYSIRK